MCSDRIARNLSNVVKIITHVSTNYLCPKKIMFIKNEGYKSEKVIG